MVDAVNVEENTTKKFYTAEEVAEILRISRSTAYKYLNSDECPFNRMFIGKRVVVPVNAFEMWYVKKAKRADRKKYQYRRVGK